MPTWVFDAPVPYRAYGRWWFAIQGLERRCYGPFPSEPRALSAREALFRRWIQRATSLHGETVRLADTRWLVTLPPDTPCAGRPFHGQAIAHHDPLPAPPSELG